MNDDELVEWLDLRWNSILSSTDQEEDSDVDRLVNSDTVSIRYAFVTQLLGKFAQPDRDILCLQMGSSEEPDDTGRWDPRSFCSRLVVPWVQRNQSVLGTSTDPYVNNPLRRRSLDVNMESLRSRAQWDALIPIQELARNALMLLSEDWRVTLLREICDELDSHATRPADRLEWAALLTG